MARPKLTIDGEAVERLASLHCTHQEIADILGCSRDTLEKRFSAEIRRGRAKQSERLRTLQWEAAENGNVTMLIHLGKFLLSQNDRALERESVDEAQNGHAEKPDLKPTAQDIEAAIRSARGES